MQGFTVSYDFIVEENNNERNNANENNEVFYGIAFPPHNYDMRRFRAVICLYVPLVFAFPGQVENFPICGVKVELALLGDGSLDVHKPETRRAVPPEGVLVPGG